MFNPGFTTEAHWGFPLRFRFADGEDFVDLTDIAWLARAWTRDGTEFYVWRSAGAAVDEGNIIISEAGQGLIVLEAPLPQHAAREAGDFAVTWKAYDVSIAESPLLMADGVGYLSTAPELPSHFEVLHARPGLNCTLEGAAALGNLGVEGSLYDDDLAPLLDDDGNYVIEET